MKFIVLIVALFIATPVHTNAQVFSGGGGGGGSGRHCNAGGGSLTLHLSAKNKFPEDKALGFAYGTLNRSTSAYVVCFKNTKPTPDVDTTLLSCKVTTKDGAGKISQSGIVGCEVVNLSYDAKPKQDGSPVLETLEIGDEQFDLKNGRVFVVSEFEQEINVKQYALKKVAQTDVEAFVKLILDVAENKTPPQKHAT